MMDYKDINSDLCVRCGYCCKVQIPVNIQSDLRVFEFYKAAGLNVSLVEGSNIVKLDMGYCEQLDVSDGLYRCKIYDTRPQLCKDFNCLAWATCHNMQGKSDALNHAFGVYRKMKNDKIN